MQKFRSVEKDFKQGRLSFTRRKSSKKSINKKFENDKVLTVIALDDYEDIFDDFDISPYIYRRISNDFKNELIRRLTEINGSHRALDIILTVPEENRDVEVEEEILKRLSTFVHTEYLRMRRRFKFSLLKSLSFLALGPTFLIASYLSKKAHLLSEYLMVGVYFFTWEGLDSLIETLSDLKAKLNMYQTLNKSNISFASEEEFDGIKGAG